MRIAVMGAGAVGCFLGGKLALAGEEVVFVARGERLRALSEEGLRIVEGSGETLVRPTAAVGNPEDAGTVDAVVLCVKLFDRILRTRALSMQLCFA
jgi:2-dehydropantoate 2-reductase